MRVPEIIQKKRDGGELTAGAHAKLVEGYGAGSVPDYQMAAFLMSVYFRGMTPSETAAFTMALVQSGKTLDLGAIRGVKVDKHSTGGVGDKTSLVLIPLVAASGAPVAKLSGRGLGHTGGTIDKLEAIPGFRTELSSQAFIDQVNRIGCAIAGATTELVPADKKLYALREVTATVDSTPLIAASVMSKKIAGGSDAIVLDVKTGSGAFMNTMDSARGLAQAMVQIGTGAARAKFAEMVAAQGGDRRVVDDPALLPSAKLRVPVESPVAGVIGSIDAQAIGIAAMTLGAGRATKDDVIDPAVGVVLVRKVGDPVKQGEPLAVVHASDAGKANEAVGRVKAAYHVASWEPLRRPLILEVIA